MNRLFRFGAFGALVLGLSAAPVSASTNLDTRIAVLRGLDKITGRIINFDV